MNLRDQILALPCDALNCSNPSYDPATDYVTGCQDMQQAAADLAARHDVERAELVEALREAQSVMWMAEEYAQGGGSYSIEMRDYAEAKRLMDTILAKCDQTEEKP